MPDDCDDMPPCMREAMRRAALENNDITDFG